MFPDISHHTLDFCFLKRPFNILRLLRPARVSIEPGKVLNPGVLKPPHSHWESQVNQPRERLRHEPT
ncbi:hypothetical protein H1R20_g2060, partial [Candolleomyces eurysporus]